MSFLRLVRRLNFRCRKWFAPVLRQDCNYHQNVTSKEGRFTPAVTHNKVSVISGGKPPFLTCYILACLILVVPKFTLPYSSTFKDHLAHPRNVGEVPNATVIAEEVNPVCGDRLRLSLLIEDGEIVVAKYLAYGCPPTLVTGSVLTELITGKTVDDARALTRAELIDHVGGLPSRKHHAAALAIEALASALNTWCNFV